MVTFFGRILKALPYVGVLCVLWALGDSLYNHRMDQTTLVPVAIGFGLVLTMFLKIEAASLRYYLNLTVLGGLFFGILTVVYMIVGNHPKQWDLTKGNRLSLAPQTVEVLQRLSKPVTIDAYATANEPYYSYLSQFSAVTPKLKFNIINPYKETVVNIVPGQEIKVDDLLVQCGERSSSISFDASGNVRDLEGDIVNAVLAVSQEKAPVVYFVTRHGEKTPLAVAGESGDRLSYSKFAVDVLGKRVAMAINIIDLQSDRVVAPDCELLFIAGPTSDYSEIEIAAIEAYLSRGGSLLAMIDPARSPESYPTRLVAMLAKYGIEISEGPVVDYDSYAASRNAFVPLVQSFSPYHEITENLQNLGGNIPMDQACAVKQFENMPSGLTGMELLRTSQNSWTLSMSDFLRAASAGTLQTPPSSEWASQSLGVAVWKSPSATSKEDAARKFPRIVVFGDSDFLTNTNLGNLQAMLGYFTVGWLTKRADMASVPKRILPETPMILSPSQRNLVNVIAIYALPFSILLSGLAYTTARRRKR
jgi:ABC-type uncharacterized transport system involved in gliding motility auxiliary subunit